MLNGEDGVATWACGVSEVSVIVFKVEPVAVFTQGDVACEEPGEPGNHSWCVRQLEDGPDGTSPDVSKG